MKTLKQLIQWQEVTGESDISVIKQYFIENNREQQGIEMVSELAKSQIEKMQRTYDRINMWTCCLPTDYIYTHYPLDIAIQLHNIELDYIIHEKITGERLKWAKNNIPSIKKPYIYFQDCLKWLKENGIEFMDNGLNE